MKTPKIEEPKLPYASTVASFYNDQGSLPLDSSFLGRLFSGAGRTMQTQTQPGGRGTTTQTGTIPPVPQTRPIRTPTVPIRSIIPPIPQTRPAR